MGNESTGFAQLRSRYGAFLIDAMLFPVAWFMGALVAGSIGMDFNRWNALALLAAYFGLIPATPLQGTPGKRACSIRITDVHGRPLGVIRSLARFAASIPSIGLFGIGFLVAAFTRRRQALHDLIAGTLVVTLNGKPEGDAPRLSWPARIAAGLVVVSSALMAYGVSESYRMVTMRLPVNTMWQDFSDYRAQVEDALLHGRPMPPPATARVKSLRADPDGSIVLEPIDSVSTDGRYVFTPRIVDGRVIWTCRATNIPERFLHYSCFPRR